MVPPPPFYTPISSFDQWLIKAEKDLPILDFAGWQRDPLCVYTAAHTKTANNRERGSNLGWGINWQFWVLESFIGSGHLRLGAPCQRGGFKTELQNVIGTENKSIKKVYFLWIRILDTWSCKNGLVGSFFHTKTIYFIKVWNYFILGRIIAPVHH